ncbi:DUF3813 family protein [Salimicrobium halophilum]|uniref:DUF3813 domain-containing protein n=1 Tax=Salimicrobium halophilum TaxID=86666 RepID=A0A1G8TTM6_9BACI|nr:DUF3813 family protein [Salimicrobium halophilum]SDJ44285.1 Protein of unknown function [Salimicrobium halophilum]
MENRFFDQAKQAVERVTNRQRQSDIEDNDMQSAREAIQAAYEQCSPQERAELQQLEEELERRH